MGQAMASWGYDVFAVDTKSYLEAFTGKTTLQPGDVGRDFYSLAAWAASEPGERVALVGWSEGAGLVVLAASMPEYHSKYFGVVTLGLSDSNVIGWRWRDDLTYLTKRPPEEPTFSCLELIPRVAPLPVVMLQSSRDEYVPARESRQLFGAARDPKRYFLIEAQNHRFDGNIREFNQRLKESLQWVTQDPRS
jgi:dienelactone hydrolase